MYRGFVVANIDARDDSVHFTNGDGLRAGKPDVVADVIDEAARSAKIAAN